MKKNFTIPNLERKKEPIRIKKEIKQFLRPGSGALFSSQKAELTAVRGRSKGFGQSRSVAK